MTQCGSNYCDVSFAFPFGTVLSFCFVLGPFLNVLALINLALMYLSTSQACRPANASYFIPESHFLVNYLLCAQTIGLVYKY